MITVLDALVLVGFGVLAALVCVFAGVVIDMRYLNRKLLKPVPKASPITQQIPAVKP